MYQARLARNIVAATLSTALLSTTATAQLTRVFVNAAAPAGGDGVSWATAFDNLQDALSAARGAGGTVVDVWVAAGTYTPDLGSAQTPGDRSASFIIDIPLNGIGFFGGFAGGETLLSQRNVAANVTILSGDLAGDDLTLGTAENSYHVMKVAGILSTTRIDGFTISGGSANGPFASDRDGAGVQALSGAPSFANCTLTGNTAAANGGALFVGSTINLDTCTLSGNSANSGGAIYAQLNVNATACNFNNNTASNRGGGIFRLGSGVIALSNSTFRNNTAFIGGGVHFESSAGSASIESCTFLSNIGGVEGGAIRGLANNMTVVNSVFIGNATGASGRGGAIANSSNGPSIVNSTFVGNTAGQGGAINVTVSNGRPVITNCILWLNSDNGGVGESAQIVRTFATAPIPVVNSSLIQGLTGTLGGIGNFDADPMFVDADGVDNILGNDDDNVRLLSGSPAIDTGDNAAVPVGVTTDRDGAARIQCAGVDVGAFESPFGTGAPVITCPADATVECGAPTDPTTTGQAVAVDGCSGVPIATTFADAVTAACGNTSTITRTWSATDTSGNVVSCAQTITIVDTTAPILTTPADASIACDAPSDPAATGAATATDACDAAPAVTFADSTTPGACPQNSTITRTWTASDACGNSVSADQIITISDTLAPVVTPPADVTVECGASTDPTSTGAATAADNCDAAPTVTFADTVTPGICPQESVITRTWTATDACGNASSASQVITIADSVAPVLSIPADAVVECDQPTDPTSLGQATAADDCDAAPTVTFSDATAAGACAHESVITRTWTATDACGNSANAVQTISVFDSTAPQLTIDTTPITVVDVDCSGDESVTLPAATATDNCDGAVTITDDAPPFFPAGETTTVTFTATDACGNASSAAVDVSVEFGSDIKVIAKRFIIGFGTRPFVTREPLAGITVSVFDRSPGSCANDILYSYYWRLRFALPEVFANCTPLATGVTDASGRVTINVPPGNYLVASHFDADGDGVEDFFLGRFTNVQCGELEVERLFMFRLARGRRVGCRWHRLTGSELVVVEPEEIVWDGAEQEYPFIFDSVGAWDVTVGVAPPDGFVADYDQLTENVTDELDAVQFTVTELGSDLVPTPTHFDILHKGVRHVIDSEIGIKLTPDYARSRGFDVKKLRARGLIVEPMPRKRPLRMAPAAPRGRR